MGGASMAPKVLGTKCVVYGAVRHLDSRLFHRFYFGDFRTYFTRSQTYSNGDSRFSGHTRTKSRILLCHTPIRFALLVVTEHLLCTYRSARYVSAYGSQEIARGAAFNRNQRLEKDHF